MKRPTTALIRFGVAVGTVSQLMILTEPASAVSQPRPTPAASDSTANTATKTTTDAAVAAAKAFAGPKPRRSRRARAHTHTMNGSASPAVAFTATATAISADARHVAAAEGQRDARHHQPDHQHLVVHATHQMDDHQRVQYADPQCGSSAGADMPGDPRSGPDQQCQARAACTAATASCPRRRRCRPAS